ncbi:MAG: DNA gyrase inhibitor YacG [Blastochloris sp.]|nr:DNA gyrase inhibitor YacG [Blastochloris sp.]
MKVVCPTCRRRGAWFEDRFGPFCSERCKLVDLGKWFNAEHVISEPLSADHFEDSELLDSIPEVDGESGEFGRPSS